MAQNNPQYLHNHLFEEIYIFGTNCKVEIDRSRYKAFRHVESLNQTEGKQSLLTNSKVCLPSVWYEDSTCRNNRFVFLVLTRAPHTVYIAYMVEAPLYRYWQNDYRRFKNVFNWTVSYRRDSDIRLPLVF